MTQTTMHAAVVVVAAFLLLVGCHAVSIDTRIHNAELELMSIDAKLHGLNLESELDSQMSPAVLLEMSVSQEQAPRSPNNNNNNNKKDKKSNDDNKKFGMGGNKLRFYRLEQMEVALDICKIVESTGHQALKPRVTMLEGCLLMARQIIDKIQKEAQSKKGRANQKKLSLKDELAKIVPEVLRNIQGQYFGLQSTTSNEKDQKMQKSLAPQIIDKTHSRLSKTITALKETHNAIISGIKKAGSLLKVQSDPKKINQVSQDVAFSITLLHNRAQETEAALTQTLSDALQKLKPKKRSESGGSSSNEANVRKAARDMAKHFAAAFSDIAKRKQQILDQAKKRDEEKPRASSPEGAAKQERDKERDKRRERDAEKKEKEREKQEEKSEKRQEKREKEREKRQKKRDEEEAKREADKEKKEAEKEKEKEKKELAKEEKELEKAASKLNVEQPQTPANGAGAQILFHKNGKHLSSISLPGGEGGSPINIVSNVHVNVGKGKKKKSTTPSVADLIK